MSDEQEWYDYIEAKIRAFEALASTITKQINEMVLDYSSMMHSIKKPKLRQDATDETRGISMKQLQARITKLRREAQKIDRQTALLDEKRKESEVDLEIFKTKMRAFEEAYAKKGGSKSN